jgi:hypothetical protein
MSVKFSSEDLKTWKYLGVDRKIILKKLLRGIEW